MRQRAKNVTMPFVIAIAAVASSPVWAVNKCPAPGGKYVYQDLPCDDAQKVDLSGSGQANADATGNQYWQREIARQKRADRVLDAVNSRKIFIGMTADEAIQSWGRPTRVNADISARGRQEQWVYRRGGGADQYVYVENGIVTTIQDRP